MDGVMSQEEINALLNGSADSGEQKPQEEVCLLYTSPSPRDISGSRMPSSA